MKKLVNGELVDMTAEEIAAREAEETANNAAKIAAHLPVYRDKKASVFTYKGVDMQLKDGARADLAALYFQCLINTNIPDNQVMAKWQEQGFDTLNITAGDLRANGHLFAEHRQKCFAVADALNPADYDTIEDLETAFDAAYTGE